MDTLKLFGIGIGDIFASLMVWAPAFAFVAAAAGVATLLGCRAHLAKTGRPTTLATSLIVVALCVLAPLGGCGLGAKYGVERALAEIATNGGLHFGQHIATECDPHIRAQLGISAVDAVVKVAEARSRVKAALVGRNVRARIAGVLDLTYLSALEVASYTFFTEQVVWRDLRDRAQLFLSKPSSKLLEHVLGFLTSAARSTFIFFAVMLALCNGLAWLIVLVVGKRRPPKTYSTA